MNKLILCVIPAIVQLNASCAEPNKETSVLFEDHNDESAAAPLKILDNDGNFAIDTKGRRWRKVGAYEPREFTQEDLQKDMEHFAAEDSASSRDSLENLALSLRATRVEGGVVYETESIPHDVAELAKKNPVPPTMQGHQGWGGRKGESISDFSTTTMAADGILGPDTRVREFNTSLYPQRANGRWTGSGCSGTFIGSRTVLISAHCAYNRGTNSWINMGKFVPGQNSGTNNNQPWGQWTVQSMTIATSWITETDNAKAHDHDYGVVDLIIDPGYVGSPGWYGVEALNTWNTTHAISARGYPTTAPGGSGISPNTQQWRSAGLTTPTPPWTFPSRILSGDIDVTYGNSGGCIAKDTNCVGITTSWFPSISTNYFRKWDATYWSFVQAYSAHF